MTTTTSTAETLARLAAELGPAVVGLGRGWGNGSGVVVARDTVLTAAHNLRGEEVTVVVGESREAATVLGRDPALDLAVIRAATGDVAPVAWASAALAGIGIGTEVFALANPGGRGLRVTAGHVSAARHPFRGPRGRRVAGGLEHTAPLPRGSSGGPLVDAGGRLLGLNALRLEGGLILAIPADATLQERAGALARGEAVGGPRLGVALAPPRVARKLRRAVGLPERDGLLVGAVQEGSPAQQAGLERGDLIVTVAGRPVASIDALHDALDSVVGGPALGIVRGTEERVVTVTFE